MDMLTPLPHNDSVPGAPGTRILKGDLDGRPDLREP
jgi:hypothetical protein